MVFETVLKVPKSALHGEGENRYLKKGDLEALAEHNLLFFKRTSKYHILNDYPCLGASERRLLSSKVEGPFESAPDIGEQEEDSEVTAETLELLVPVKLMPVEFEPVSLVEYGTHTDKHSRDFLRFFPNLKDNYERMTQVGNEVLANLRNSSELQEVPDNYGSRYKTLTSNCLLEFFLGRTFTHPSIPAIEITILGMQKSASGEVLQQLLQELGIRELEKWFPDSTRDVGIRDSTREGLAYNLVLDGKSISEIIGSKNVLL